MHAGTLDRPRCAYEGRAMVSDKPTQLPEPGAPDVLFVVDISGYVFRAYHALPPLSSPSGEPTHAVLGVTTMLQKLIQEQTPALLAVAMDSRTRSFRHELYDAYKANRPPAPEDLKQQMRRVREIVEAYGIPVLQQDGLEADDVIATAVGQARAAGLRVVIVSADKDLLQLVGDDVVMYDTGRNRVFGPQETVAKLGVPPHQVRDYLALVGDSSDNVPGVPSVGPKTAAKLLGEFGSLDDLLARLPDVSKRGLREKLTEHAEAARLSQKLVTLKSNANVAADAQALASSGADTRALHGLFSELGFTRLLAQLDTPQEAHTRPASADSPAGPAGPRAEYPAPGSWEGETRLILRGEELDALASELQQAERVALFSITDGPRAIGDGVVGLALGWHGGAAYVPVAHSYLGVPAQLPPEAVARALANVMAGTHVAKVSADAKRELLAWTKLLNDASDTRGNTIRGIDFDNGLASYLLDAELHGHSMHEISRELFQLDLAAQDVLLPKRRLKKASLPSESSIEEIANHGGQMVRAILGCYPVLLERVIAEGCESLLRDLELPLSAVLAQMECTGIRVDAVILNRLSQRVAEQLVELEAKCTELAGHEFNVASPRQLETILFDELGLPVVKKTKTARSTDHSVLEELALHHELPAAILEHRMLAKLKNTYLDALPKVIGARSGRIHTDFRQTVAATGRLSSTDPNLQNIPIRTQLGREIRKAFVARDGWSIVSADYSQIELRVLAHLSHDPELVEAFRADEDVHVRTARALFGVAPEDVTREMRAQAKTVNFAVIYGQTQFALARNLRIERSQAARYIRAFFEQYAGVKAFMDKVVEEGRETGIVRTLCGRTRKLPDLRSANRVRRQAAERVARNTPIQGTAADIIKLAMIAVDRAMANEQLESRMLLTVHDELVFEAPRQECESLQKMVKRQMEGVMQLDVPLVVDVSDGDTWGQAH